MIVNDDDDPKIKNNNTGDLCEVERNSSIDSMDRTVVRGPFQKIYLKDCFCCLIVHSIMGIVLYGKRMFSIFSSEQNKT